MTEVQKPKSNHGRNDSRPKASRRISNTRSSATKSFAPDIAFTMKPRSVERKPIHARNRPETLEIEVVELTEDQSATDHPMQTKVDSSTIVPEIETIEMIGDGVGVVPLSDEEAKSKLEEFTILTSKDSEFYETYSVEQAAKKLNVQSFVVESWVESGRLIGVLNEKDELRIPRVLIRDGQYAPHLNDVQDYFDDPRQLWQYLVTEVSLGTEMIRPIDLHFTNSLERVINLPYSLAADFT